MRKGLKEQSSSYRERVMQTCQAELVSQGHRHMEQYNSSQMECAVSGSHTHPEKSTAINVHTEHILR